MNGERFLKLESGSWVRADRVVAVVVIHRLQAPGNTVVVKLDSGASVQDTPGNNLDGAAAQKRAGDLVRIIAESGKP